MNYEIITIKNKDYYIINNMIFNIESIKGSVHGLYDSATNTVFSIKNISKIINYMETQKDFLRVLYIGDGFNLIKEHFTYNTRFNFQNNNISKQSFTTLIFYKSVLENTLYLTNLEIYGTIIIYDMIENYDNIKSTLLSFSNMTITSDNTFNNMFLMVITKNLDKQLKVMFLDTETTGLYEKNALPHEIDKFNNSRMIELGYIINDIECSYLIKPDNFTIENSNIHGITTEEATNKGSYIMDVLKKFYIDLSTVDMIICHNINFDMNILLAECFRYNYMDLINLIEMKQKLCTMVMSKKLLKLYKTPKLVELYKMFYDDIIIQEHRSLADCKLCKSCYIMMIKIK